MLLIDDHASHITTQMIDYCISQKIILLCLSTHTTHLLQSLNVEVFASLATAYKTHVQRVTQLEISYSINKTNFLKLYQLTRHETITSLNIRKTWTATELLSFNSVLVLQHFSSVKKLKLDWSRQVESLRSSQVLDSSRLDSSQNSWLEYLNQVRILDLSIWIESEDWDRVLTRNTRLDSSRHEAKYY